MKRRKGSLERLRGTVLAEAAIVMTLLCMVTLGALQYGWFFYCLHTATNAARQGARVACVLGGTHDDGMAALEAAMGTYLFALTTSPTDVTETTVDGKLAWQGEVTIPAAKVALMPISFLPVPDCHVRVTMAKEGAS